MNENFFISKNRQLPNDEDFQFLRSEGLKYIENLSSSLWTDYNTHDPGITILEALCYAITELGYRSDFDMKDLLADKDGNPATGQALFTAKNIFPNNPLTVEDYRKVLIDTVGVHNAFLFPAKNVEDLEAEDIPTAEIPVYADCKKDALVYNKTEHDAIDIRGLYKIILDLDNTAAFGDLNTGNFIYSFTDPLLVGLNVEIILPAWRDMDKLLPWKVIGNIVSVNVFEDNTATKWEIKLTWDDSGTNKTFEYTVRKTLSNTNASLDVVVTNELEKEKAQEDILKLYKKKLEAIEDILTECWNKLHGHRNLCEDFLSVDTVFYTGIAVCADIETAVDADNEEVLGNVFFLLEQYLNPTVNFYLLQELLTKGMPTDEIFEGPSLEHGFIDTGELIAAQLRSEIRVSDIINLIMDIEGVVAVKNLLLTSYDENGSVLQGGQKWCIHIEPFHKPVLDIYRGKILFFKNKLPFIPKLTEALDVLRVLEANLERPKLKGHEDDLPVPNGTFYELDDYWTVQYELPQTYGISEWGLSNEESYQRKVKAKQLRAYFMFYDQLLANFFSQLKNAKKLFGLDKDLVNTYFTQFLTEIKDIQNIYREYTKPISANTFNLQQVLNVAAEAPADILDPLYGQQLSLYKLHANLIESEETFDDRRNRFLDHLMARFSETFSNHVFLLYTADKEKIAAKDLMDDKILFLQDYPVISAERGKAFDCLLPSKYTFNVSGLEKRVSRFTGIHNYIQRRLFCQPGYEIINNGTDADPKYIFHILNHQDNVVIKSIKEYTTVKETENVLDEVYDGLLIKTRYKIVKNASAVFEIQILDEDGVQIAVAEKTFSNNLSASNYLKTLMKSFEPQKQKRNYDLVNTGTIVNPKYIFNIYNLHPDLVLHSIKTYSVKEEADAVVNDLYDNFFFEDHYIIVLNAAAKYEIQVLDINKTPVAVTQKQFASELAAEIYMPSVVNALLTVCDAEGMHLVEHLLLRPHFAATPVLPQTPEEDYELMQVCLDKDCQFCGEEDPYSFRVSVFLPFWVTRFRDMDFRKYFEEIMQTEAPAHIAVKVCWLGYTSMKKFEDAYWPWLKALRRYGKDLKETDLVKQQHLKEASNKMVEFMAGAHSEYPEARLHDCETGTTNPVRLGTTVLGGNAF